MVQTTEEKTVYVDGTRWIDYIMIKNRWASASKTLLDTDCRLGYELLMAEVKANLKKKQEMPAKLSVSQPLKLVTPGDYLASKQASKRTP